MHKICTKYEDVVKGNNIYVWHQKLMEYDQNICSYLIISLNQIDQNL